MEKIRAEVKNFEDNKIDVEKLIIQSRESDRIRSQMVVLEKRVQVICENLMRKDLHIFMLCFLDPSRRENCVDWTTGQTARAMC